MEDLSSDGANTPARSLMANSTDNLSLQPQQPQQQPQKKFPYLPDLPNLQEESFDTFKWIIKDFTQLRQKAQQQQEELRKIISPIVKVKSGSHWRLLMFPLGNLQNNNDQLSVYLEYIPPSFVVKNEDEVIDYQEDGIPVAKSIHYTNPSASGAAAAAKNDESSTRYSKCAQFCIKLSNPSNDSIEVYKDAKHRFSADETDWGFSRFIDFKTLLTQTTTTSSTAAAAEGGIGVGGESSANLMDGDSFVFTVYIRSIKDEVGTLWHNFNNWDSKLETGYVGLKNQGATCYMNSLLQSLYFTSLFRKAVYMIPTQEDDPSKSVALALQRVFYNLSNSLHAVDTRELTKSFGWDTLDAFMQHDVQEFNRVLQDNLETKMKGTRAEGAIEKLFVGKMKSYVKCVNVDYESKREETFYDVQLNVKGRKNLHESFEDYVQVEMLDGENKYQSEKYGLQDAKKGVVFTKMPPVLHLQLKRFEYDFQRDAMVKINDRHEYPLVIDLKEFVQDSNEKEKSHVDVDDSETYELYGVLVHSGDVNGGHYCAFLRPTLENKWFKFDDDRVTPATVQEVFEDNFGGEVPGSLREMAQRDLVSKRQLIKRFTNAYMLVYIKRSLAASVLDLSDENQIIPYHVKEDLEKEVKAREERERELQERHLFTKVAIMRESKLVGQVIDGFDLGLFDTNSYSPTCLKTDCSLPVFMEKIKKDVPFKQFQLDLANKLQIPLNKFRLWNFYGRQNHTCRPEGPLSLADKEEETIEGVYLKFKAFPELRLLIEESDKKAPDSPDKVDYVFKTLSNEEIVVFLKYYSCTEKKAVFAGSISLKVSTKCSDLVGMVKDVVAKNLGSTFNTSLGSLRLYEEVKPGMIELLRSKGTVRDADLMTGDILILAMEGPAAAVQQQQQPQYDLDTAVNLSVQDYYDFMLHRFKITFKPKPSTGQSKTFTFTMSKKADYDTMAKKVAKQLGVDDYLKLMFFTNPTGQEYPKNHIKRTQNHSLNEILNTNYYSTYLTNVLGSNPVAGKGLTFWYDILTVSIIEYENMRQLEVITVDQHGREKETLDVMVNKTGSTFSDLVGKLKLKYPNSFKAIVPPQVPRVFTVNANGRGVTIYKPTDLLNSVNGLLDGSAYIYIEAEHFDLQPTLTNPNQKIVHVYHFNRDPSRGHSIPFSMVLRTDLTIRDFKKQLQAKIAASDKDFQSRTKLCVVKGEKNDCVYFHDYEVTGTNPADEPDNKNDDKYILDLFDNLEKDYIGIDHIERRRATQGVSPSNANVHEKSIKIFG